MTGLAMAEGLDIRDRICEARFAFVEIRRSAWRVPEYMSPGESTRKR